MFNSFDPNGHVVTLTRKTLRTEGFAGFRPMGELDIMRVPQSTGIFAIVAPDKFHAQFLKKSTAGVFKKKDPTLPAAALEKEWVPDSDVLYIGKAGPGSKANRGLRRQIKEFIDFGEGKPPGHWDGRLIWQVAQARHLMVAWLELPAEAVVPAEAYYHTRFIESYERLPFANLVQSRTKS